MECGRVTSCYGRGYGVNRILDCSPAFASNNNAPTMTAILSDLIHPLCRPRIVRLAHASGSQFSFAVAAVFGFNVPASPPDVRQGYALPSSLSFNSGYAPGLGLARDIQGHRGHSPQSFSKADGKA